jgi:hypothetical protein
MAGRQARRPIQVFQSAGVPLASAPVTELVTKRYTIVGVAHLTGLYACDVTEARAQRLRVPDQYT